MEWKELLMQVEDIHKATEIISTKLKKPVIIENKSFELVSYSSSFDGFDQTQQKTILSKKCPVFIIDHLKKEGIVQRLERTSHPVRVHPIEDIGFRQRVVIAAKHMGQTVGYVWIQESDDWMEEKDMEFLRDITPYIGKMIYDLHKTTSEKDNRKDEVLWKLLNHEYSSESQLKKDAALVKISLPERASVIVFSVTESRYRYMLDYLERIVRTYKQEYRMYFLKSEYQLVLLMEAESEGESLRKARTFISRVKTEVGEEEFYCFLIGVGKEYDTLREIRKSFLESLEVIEVASFLKPRPETMPREFSKMGTYRYLAALYEKNSADDYYSGDLLKLIKNDREKQTDLLRTLEMYLANNTKGKQTASELYIHPNTLNYRIKQIQELTSIDFQDFNMKAHLYMELLLVNNVDSYYHRYLNALS
ncbi:PucR family transcriptional regulator [Salimicrobium salexigens]|uniref:DNA-binding transcriptional regulator, PucR family n=1 Tax=Salimicrobium salexigens TaxID=908941 RepID=A0ABY1KTW7_9BACI|nr:helix-turn-helix domain-containing protein [Salimicrobium salexigens]SIS76955.1 DNA-binding transcriptional regulator, PucR family [Salimicrobium salexigens]